jgi:cytochrome c peroxidase
MRRYALTVLALCALFGCEPARRYDGRPPHGLPGPAVVPTEKTTAAEQPKAPAATAGPEVSPDLAWNDTTSLPPQVPIRFIAPDRPEWPKLERFWNEVAGGPVQIKVPLGLDDPGPHIPAANPLTLARWKLGKELFFDDGYLSATRKLSCAGCHVPTRGFASTDREARIAGFDTPTLLNCVYRKYLFWDGRADALEEVVQRTLEDEGEPADGAAHPHVWSGVVHRLRGGRRDYNSRFKEAFGTLPTQDALGKALATYLRTLLCGNSIVDRARQAQKERNAANLEWTDLQKVLDPAALDSVGRSLPRKDDVARELQRGYELFFNLGGQKAHCVLCHGGSGFTDDGFHNLGVGVSADRQHETGKEPGRFARVPAGLKERSLIGAFKTPTLRGLPRTFPYFHDGSEESLPGVVRWHTQEGKWSPYLDPLLRAESDPPGWRKLNLAAEDSDALVLFLRALNGDLPPPEVIDSPTGSKPQ